MQAPAQQALPAREALARDWLLINLSSASGSQPSLLLGSPLLLVSIYCDLQCQKSAASCCSPLSSLPLFSLTFSPLLLHSCMGQGAIAHLPSPSHFRLSPTMFSPSFTCWAEEDGQWHFRLRSHEAQSSRSIPGLSCWN